MKQIKIKQEFLDNVKNGVKNFEIRKKDYGFKDWTKVELVVVEHNINQPKAPNTTYHCNCGIPSKKYISDKCIKETLIVELKQTEMTAFEISSYLTNRIWNCSDRFEDNRSEMTEMLINIKSFVNDYFKQGDTLYWYDLRLVE